MIVRDARQLATLLQGDRVRLLELLQEPQSASAAARRTGAPRQQVNYHLRELEKAGLVELVEEQRRGNCVERVLRATARQYVISPEVLGAIGEDPAAVRDRFSSTYLVVVAARTIHDLATLREGADAAGLRLATLTLESEVCFASVTDRNAFAKELSEALARLIVKYHDGNAPGGPRFRVTLGAYPAVSPQDKPPEALEER
jgi:DNA-binding transcriptional ArsR family regulator